MYTININNINGTHDNIYLGSAGTSRIISCMPSRQKKNFHHESLPPYSPLRTSSSERHASWNDRRVEVQAQRRQRKRRGEQVPGEKVRDASALARELRWRVNLALNGESGDEGGSGGSNSNGGISKGKGVKRRLSETPDAEGFGLSARFRNFRPKVWDAQESLSKEESMELLSSHGPPEGEGIEWTKHWLGENTVLKEEDGDGMAVDGENMRAKVRKVHSVLSRVRRTPVGLERQHIIRKVEYWEWNT